MARQKFKLVKGKRILAVVLIILCMTAGMLLLFIHNSNSIHDKIMKKEVEHQAQVSGYLTKIIHSEMEHCIEILASSEETLCVSENPVQEKMRDVLQEVKKKTDFNAMGIIGMDGQSIDTDDTEEGLSDPELMEKIKNNENYISDILTNGKTEQGQILVAVPLHNDDKIVGAIWGQYPVTAISEKIQLNETSDMYFQIIDTNGTYISRSGNQNALAENLPLWEELKLYQLSKDMTIKKIQKNVSNHKSGSFYFRYENEGRFVTYEPLGINNWYVFSVLVEDELNAYVQDIKELSMNLLVCFSVFVTLLFSVVGIAGYQGNRVIKKQNQQLAVKTQLFRMALRKTKAVPFEISLKENELKIYHYHEEAQKGEDCECMEEFSLETLLKSGRIREEDAEKYKQMYEDMLSGSEIQPLVLQLKINGVWEWNKIHMLRVDSDSMVGFFENYDKQMAQDRKFEEMDYKARHDALTGVYNREAFRKEVEAYLEQEKENTSDLCALFLLDLDHFKEVNDTLGHIVGDKALHEAAASLKSVIRAKDLICRIGGDEFMLFIKDAESVADIRFCAEKINRILVKTYEKDGKEVTVSASIGIALVEEGITFESLYERADRALYEVKNKHRNQYWIA